MNKPSQQKQLAWTEHLKSQCESGLSLQTYCEQHLLKPSQFWYWKRKLQGSASDHSANGSRSNQSGFVAANVVEASVDQGLTVKRPNGISLSGINEHTDSYHSPLPRNIGSDNSAANRYSMTSISGSKKYQQSTSGQ